MKRSKPEVSGTREELAAELAQAAEGWPHFGNDRLATEAAVAVEQLAEGAPAVTVGHTTYAVKDG